MADDRSSLRTHWPLGPVLARRIAEVDAKAERDRTAWDCGVVSAAAWLDDPRSLYGTCQVMIAAVVGVIVGLVATESLPLGIAIAAPTAAVSYWAVPTMWAAMAAVRALHTRRHNARAELHSLRAAEEAQPRAELTRQLDALEAQMSQAQEREAERNACHALAQRLRGQLERAEREIAEIHHAYRATVDSHAGRGVMGVIDHQAEVARIQAEGEEAARPHTLAAQGIFNEAADLIRSEGRAFGIADMADQVEQPGISREDTPKAQEAGASFQASFVAVNAAIDRLVQRP